MKTFSRNVSSQGFFNLTLFKNVIALCCLLTLTTANASNEDFITVWKTDNSSRLTSDNEIKVPVFADGGSFTIDWGDGEISSEVTRTVYHTYETPGTYTVTFSLQEDVESEPQPDSIFYIRLSKFGDTTKLIEIKQWGSIPWSTMEGAFSYCNHLQVTATDLPNLSRVSSTSEMFYSSTSFNHPLDDWDVSNVTDMSRMFYNALSFNQPLNNWDTSNVTDMSSMFRNASSFDQPLNDWDTSNVTGMSGMFQNANSFDQSLNDWDTSNVTGMNGMFKSSSFNHPLDDWDVSNVTDMSYMFDEADNFNQPLDDWDVSNVTDMSYMFNRAYNFNQPLNGWDVSNVINIRHMFRTAHIFNQPLNSWDVSNVVDMNTMFSHALDFNQSLNNWDTSNVTDMSYMFNEADNFNQPLDDWDVSNVINMRSMFNEATRFNKPLDNWDVSNVRFMSFMFSSSNLSTENYDKLLKSWSQQSVVYQVDLGVHNVSYCSAENARQILVDSHGWIIIDGGKDCSGINDTCASITNNKGSFTMVCF